MDQPQSNPPGDEYSQYWKTVIQTMQDGLMVVDPDGVIVSVNPVMEQITGYRADELVGAHCSILDCDSCKGAHQGSRSGPCDLFRDGAIRRCRCTLRKKDGSPLYVLKNAAVIKGGGEEFLGGVETLTDLSEVVAKEREIADLRWEMNSAGRLEGMVGRSAAMLNLFNLIRSVAHSEAPVLISGESGTGKEMVANALHRLGPRAAGPFVKVNCAALNESLLESELFGHVKGAFTGADRDRAGRFEAAKGGDFLLDEVGDLPAAMQVKLLRVLQEKVIERVGENLSRPVDVRIISATHRDLGELVEAGEFRQDLYYRVAVIPIRVPPLRERKEDIPLLVEDFLDRLRKKSGKAIEGLSQAALDALTAHAWPGNVRELINALEYAFVLCPRGAIEPWHLPESVSGLSPTPRAGEAAACRVTRPAPAAAADDDERRRILEALQRTGGRKIAAARLLGISRVTLWKKMKDLDIRLEPRLG